ncbi:MAG: MauE/DoxX family redox-associated membrane protein [Halieaceae bacterium]
MSNDSLQSKLAPVLLLLRLGVGIVFVIWTADKFVNPDHTVRVYEHFYMIPWLTQNTSYLVGLAQGLLVLAFLSGFMKTWSYGLVFLLHAVSTLTPMANYFSPWEGANILFFAAWPMLAAAWALWALRDYDTLFSVDAARAA